MSHNPSTPVLARTPPTRRARTQVSPLGTHPDQDHSGPAGLPPKRVTPGLGTQVHASRPARGLPRAAPSHPHACTPPPPAPGPPAPRPRHRGWGGGATTNRAAALPGRGRAPPPPPPPAPTGAHATLGAHAAPHAGRPTRLSLPRAREGCAPGVAGSGSHAPRGRAGRAGPVPGAGPGGRGTRDPAVPAPPPPVDAQAPRAASTRRRRPAPSPPAPRAPRRARRTPS